MKQNRSSSQPKNVNFSSLEFQKQQEMSRVLFDQVTEVVFSNLKIYLEERLQAFNIFFRDLEDIKLNTTALSSLLHSKNFFTEKEYKDYFQKAKSSFGMVDSVGKMEGAIVLTKYNFSSEK